ncbi:helix-turn-helix domain-containing protein [Fibrella aquatilis]|uniref:AraC family transcriptional regulator n=1 Tax=Fibrella aquatilis TaxID=2817059 RepID=A0A939G8V1_9BACT|nr:helix-turn-helix domain-containing protein [Fibrella aquatilis]MBO0932475.1 AraC family transcriptional regulator [Fibrella aquatilis]
MVFQPNIRPHPALRPYIRHYLLLHVDLTNVPDRQRIKPVPPDAEQSLFFYPRSEVRVITNSTDETRLSATSIFVGQQTSRINIQFGQDHLIIQVCFRPGFLHQFLGEMPITAFQGKEISAEDLPDADINELNRRLREEVDYDRMIALIDSYLLKKIGRLRLGMQPIDRAIVALRMAEKPLSLDWLADQACLSSRQFERRFLARMGMSPKFYARVVRFDRAFKLKTQRPQLDWLDVAYACGYYDYAHLMRDFRQFAEVTPAMLLAQEAASPDRKTGL